MRQELEVTTEAKVEAQLSWEKHPSLIYSIFLVNQNENKMEIV